MAMDWPAPYATRRWHTALVSALLLAGVKGGGEALEGDRELDLVT